MSLLLLLIASTLQAYGKLPLAFEPNVGQSDRRVAFIARGSGVQLFLTPNEAVYRLPETIVRMQLVGANRVRARGINRLPSESNYFDRRPSITHVPHFGRVEMRQIYRGIDLAYYGNDSQLEYDFIVAPHADPSRIAFDIQGAEEIGIGEEGELRIRTSSGPIVWHAPAIYQGESRIAGGYALRGKNRIGFHVSSYDHNQPLIIDPILAWSKSIGGTGIDHAYAVAVDASECAVITGDTASTDFPTTAGAYKTTGGGVFVSKLNAAGTSLVYSTFLGPGKGLAIALRGGNAYIAGVATSAFPVTAGAYSDFANGNNVFVTELTSDGSALVYSALFGKGSSQGAGIAVDAMGNAYVTGTTVTDNFTTTSNAFQPTRPTLGQVYQGDIDAFFVKLNSSGSTLLYSTYLGSTQNDFGNGIAIDSSGNAYVAGATEGRSAPWNGYPAATSPFPTTASAYKRTFIGGASAFVTKFDPTASGAASVLYSTLIGGDDESDQARGIAIDSSGNAYVTGHAGANFPLTAGAYGAASTQGGAPITKLNAGGSALLYSAMIEGADAQKIALDFSNNAFVVGTVSSTSAFTPVNPLAGVVDQFLFLTKLNSTGSTAHYSTYIDGYLNIPLGVAVDPSGAAYVAATAFPAPFNTDALISKIVTNRPPLAEAGPDQDVNAGNSFTLDGGGSTDPDGDPLTYEWTDSSNTVVGSMKTVTLTRPQGIHTFTLKVSDGILSASDMVSITVNTIISVNLFGLVSGRVTSDDGKIDCSSSGSASCVGRYSSSTQVILTAVPGTGVTFTGWKFDCSGTGTCTLSTGSSHIVGAQFDVLQLTLSVTNAANGKVTSPSGIDCGTQCSATLPYGTMVTLTAAPELGYLFDTWSGACAGTLTPACSLTMDTNKSAGASFKEITLDALAVIPASATIAIGGQQQFSANGTFSDGSIRRLSSDHSLEAPDDYTCAITTSGAVKCWGGGPYQAMSTVPAFENAVALSAGTAHVCALFANGTVNCSGFAAPGIFTAVAVVSESGIPCMLLSDGTVRCWLLGSNPVTVSGITNAVAIGAEGGGLACAVLADGTVQCWAGLGISNGVGNSTPVTIGGISNAIAVTVGAEHACGLVADGTVKCWWRNNRGQLGDGSSFNSLSYSNTAVPVINVSGAVSIVVGDYHSCALLSNGTVKCWGMQFANGDSNDSSTPITISGLSNPVAIAAGAFHNCATFANGTVQCWGLNNVGQLGTGNPGTSTVPLPVNGLNHVLGLSWNSSNTTARMMSSGLALADSAGTPSITATAGSLSAAASLTILNTPTGTNVVTKPVDPATGGTPATVTFASVTQAGSTTLASSGTGPTPPAGFQTGNPPRYYELSTTATYAAPVTVCISYAGSTFGGQPQLFHYESGVWKDVTTSVNALDQIVCGEVTSFSPFALFEHINRPPAADAGPDQIAECGSAVTLDGTRSSDPDHDSLTYVWTGSFGRIEGPIASVNLPLGDTMATLTVSDGRLTSTDTVQVTVRDTIAPTIASATANPDLLWPPNHKMTMVTLTLSASDICDPGFRCTIDGVTSNEAITAADWELVSDLAVNLRAERSGYVDSRIYTITVRCTDASNNSSTRTVTVTVPHDHLP